MNSRCRGRWDRNRTCNLRLWSLLPFVQLRSGMYTKWLKVAHFECPKCQEVLQGLPALGATWGQNQLDTLTEEGRERSVSHGGDESPSLLDKQLF
jgi:hypothetical protein